jgi:hypothetical protein
LRYLCQYSKHLDDKINELEKEAKNASATDPNNTKPGKKRRLLMKARDHLKALGFTTAEMTSHTLLNEKDYEQSTAKFPEYFDKEFHDHDIEIKQHHGQSHYTYDKKETEAFQVWVDFANMKLGGGVFGDGFIQEETMFLETPELANVAACDQITRSGNSGGVLEGSPRPMLFKGVHRVIDIKEFPKPWDEEKYQVLLEDRYTTPLKKDEAQQIIVLAMAAPSLKGTSGQQWTHNTLRDLFNTFVAGFQLSRDVADKAATTPAGRRHAAANPPVLINTGGIGTGAFDNNPTVVAVLQVLAARQVGGVHVKLWGYDKSNIDTVTTYVESIRDAYKKSKSPTIKHLIELTFETFHAHPPGHPHTRREPPREPRSRHTRP